MPTLNTKTLYLIGTITMILGVNACQENEVDPEDLPAAEPIAIGCRGDSLSLSEETLVLENWNNGIDYIVNCVAEVTGDLIINPGVEIRFANDAGLVIQESGSIAAVGEEDDPIIFTGEDSLAGSWRGIQSYSSDVKNQLRHCTIAYAGGNAFTSNGDRGALILWADARMRIQACTIDYSAAYGINATYQNYDIQIENPTIRHCETPMYIDANAVGNITGGVYEENAQNVIRVLGGTHRVTTDQQWTNLGIPYRISSEQSSFQYLSVANATLTVDPGAILEFENGMGLIIGESDESTLIAAGTEADPILFTGVNKVKGAWGGIFFRFTNSPLNAISNATIEYAGSPGWDGAISMWANPTLKMDKVNFKSIRSCALYDAPKPDYDERSQTVNPNLTMNSVTYSDVDNADKSTVNGEGGDHYCFGG